MGRGAYAIRGLVLMLVKFNLDRWIAHRFFDRYWTPFHYLNPTDRYGFTELPADERTLFLTLILTAFPFIYAGLMFTVRRLGSLRLSPLFALFFFVPVVNLLFFAVLCGLPAVDRDRAVQGGADWLDAFIPESGYGSAAMAVLLTVPPSLLVIFVAIYGFEHYGWGLFCAVPFALGCCSVVLYGYHRERGVAACLGVTMLSLVLLGGLLIGVAIEGVLCVIMAAPIGGGLGLAGGIFGYFIQKHYFRRSDRQVQHLFAWGILALPLLLGVEQHQVPQPPVMKVSTSIVVDAPPETVWSNVISFSRLDPPSDPVFRTGIAYPTRSRLVGEGEDAVRYCVFSTGAFVEPITNWDPPERLAFSVRKQPPAMRELSPYGSIDAPHVDGFLRSTRGSFHLERLSGNQTRLTGTTWYRHKIRPVFYWRIWSDGIIQRIHGRVLRHIREQAEGTLDEEHGEGRDASK